MPDKSEVLEIQEEEIKEFPQQTTFNTDDMTIVFDCETEDE